MAASTLWLMATGWLVANTPSVAQAASELHLLGAGVLVFSLGLRVFLGFFGNGAERFEHMLPGGSELPAIKSSLLFYLSFGKSPLPNWFSHNPLWKLLYLFLFVLLGLSALSGWLMPDVQLVWRFYLPHVHATLSTLILLTIVAHLYCVVLQDLKGGAADNSAMINGHRYFQVDRDAIGKPDLPLASVRLEDLMPPRDSKGDR
jgi:Ni/Fe-hydrogenase 1 B-type cytochrome subunit